MKFSELARLLKRMLDCPATIRVDSCAFVVIIGCSVITLPYSLVIEATEDRDFFGFYSADLDGFTGIGHSIEDCLYKARWGMADHAQTLREQGLPVPTPNPNPTIVIQNDSKLQLA